MDVSGCAGVDDILAACVRAMVDANAAAQCEEMVARVTIGGPTQLYDVLARPGTVEEMRTELNESYPAFYSDALINATTPPLDKEGLRSAGLFPAALIRSAEKMAASQDDARLTYLQEEFARRGLALPHGVDGMLDDLTESACDMSLTLLDGRDA